MNRNSLIMLVVSLSLQACTADADGRRGNRQYRAEMYDASVASFAKGVERIVEDGPGATHAALLNNAGSALHRAEQHEPARDAFVNSVAMSVEQKDRSRAAYNAGNNAYAMKDQQLSLDFYKRALLWEPANVDAKFNYEFVKRQLEEQEQQNQGKSPPPPPPSEYAKQLKAEADALVAERRYRDANQLMLDGLRIDPTIQAFQSFIDKTASVATIDESNINP